MRSIHACARRWRRLAIGELLALAVVVSTAALDKETLLRQGNEAFLKGRVDEALSAYEQLIQIEPNDASIRYNLAVCFERVGRPEEAARAYARVLELDPGHARAAEALRRMAPATPPKSAPDAARRANQAFLMGRFEEAVSAYEEALRLEPRDARLRYNLAICYERRGNKERALRSYRRVLELESDHAGALAAVRRLGDVQSKASNRMDQGDQQFLKGDYSAALREYETQAKEGQASAQLLYRMGLCHERLGDLESALKRYRQALKLDPRMAEAREASTRLEPAMRAVDSGSVLTSGHLEARKPPAPPVRLDSPPTSATRTQAVPRLEPPRTVAQATPAPDTQPAPVARAAERLSDSGTPAGAETPARAKGWLDRPESLFLIGGILFAAVGSALLVRSRRDRFAVQGLISRLPVSDVLQVLAQNHKSGVLILQTPTGPARLVLDAGSIVGADIQAQSGEQAIHTILNLKGGSFVFKESDGPPKGELGSKLSIERVLLGWAYAQDELRRTQDRHPDLN